MKKIFFVAIMIVTTAVSFANTKAELKSNNSTPTEIGGQNGIPTPPPPPPPSFP